MGFFGSSPETSSFLAGVVVGLLVVLLIVGIVALLLLGGFGIGLVRAAVASVTVTPLIFGPSLPIHP